MNIRSNARLAPEERRQIVERRLAGESTVKVAEAFGVSKSYVNKLIIKAGYDITPAPKLSESDMREMLRRFNDVHTEVSIGDLAREYGVHYTTVKKALAKARLLPPPPPALEEFEEYDLTWVGRAACRSEDPEYFEYEPGRDEELEDALVRYELAKEVCSGCPVQADCTDAANDSDRMWTTRGGLMPLALRRRLKGD